MAEPSNYYYTSETKLDVKQFLAKALAEGIDMVLEHSDTIFMPVGYRHDM